MFPSKLITAHVDDQRKPNIFGNWICLINILDNVLFFVLRQIIIHTAIDFCQIIIFDIVVARKIAYYVSFWFVGRPNSQEEFQSMIDMALKLDEEEQQALEKAREEKVEAKKK